jgi:hypothetical protein
MACVHCRAGFDIFPAPRHAPHPKILTRPADHSGNVTSSTLAKVRGEEIEEMKLLRCVARVVMFQN